MPNGELQSIRARFLSAAQKACNRRGVLPPPAPRDFVSFEYKPLTGDINYYYAVLRVGSGPFDRIGITRVIKEQKVGQAVDGSAAAFFIHGIAHTFGTQFIIRAPDGTVDSLYPGIAPWLANQGLDVWGIDLRYTLVPSTTTVFNFMADWGMGVMRDDVLLATRLARFARQETCQQRGTLHLVGQSLGAALVYAVANEEAVSDEPDIGDMIPVEAPYQVDRNDAAALGAVRFAENLYRGPLAQGVYQLEDPATVKFGGNQVVIAPRAAGEAARSAPDTPSPLPGMTNKQLALTIVRQPWFPPFSPHQAACLPDVPGIATSGRFTPTERIIDFLATTVPFSPRRLMADFFGMPAGNPELPYANHLAQVRIPSLYIGAAGGYHDWGRFTNSLLGSSDRKELIVHMLPDGQERNDLGHVEPFMANEAPSRVWQAVLEWIRSHPSTSPAGLDQAA